MESTQFSKTNTDHITTSPLSFTKPVENAILTKEWVKYLLAFLSDLTNSWAAAELENTLVWMEDESQMKGATGNLTGKP